MQTFRKKVPLTLFDPHSEFNSDYIMSVLGAMHEDFIFPKNVVDAISRKVKK